MRLYNYAFQIFFFGRVLHPFNTKSQGDPSQCPEWAMIDLQGSLETRYPVALNGRFIGDLHFTHQNIPILIIGHHILYGKIVDMEKPFAVLVKCQSENSADSQSDNEHKTQGEGTHYQVKAIIKKRLLFKTRPKPIIANVPKKL